MSDSATVLPVIRTKLYRPPVTPDYVRRASLENSLDKGFSLPITIVVAPAGYGKTTLISHWLETRDSISVWLSLDEMDNNFRGFLTYFIATLRNAIPGCCPHSFKLANAQTLRTVPAIAASLLNDLDDFDDRIILVLDNYHHLRSSDIHSLIDQLLEHPSPHLHLVVLSRRDPPLSLASRRVGHQLTEIRLSDLEYSSGEMYSFLEQAAEYAVPPDVADRLLNMTEGWPAAARLAALAIRQSNNKQQFIDDFSAQTEPLREYLISEVITGLDQQVQECLLSTAILERFNAALCEAVHHGDTTKAETTIKGEQFVTALQGSGLLYIPLDNQRTWFRYHQLFADLLMYRLTEFRSQAEIERLHLRASNWYAENSYFEEAIRHALQAKDAERAAAIVGAARHDLMDTDHWIRLESWMELFSNADIEKLPQLAVLNCWMNLNHYYRLELLPQNLEHADAALEIANITETEAVQLRSELAIIRSSLAYWTMDPVLGMSLTEDVIVGTVRQPEYVYSLAVMYRVGAYQLQGNLQAAEQLLLQSLQGHPLRQPGSQARILQAMCFVYWSNANTRKLAQTAARLLELSVEQQLSWSESFGHYFLGMVHYEQNELDVAISHLEQVALDPYQYPIQNVTHSSILLGLAYQAAGLPQRALEIESKLHHFVLEKGNPAFIGLSEALQAELDLRRGHLSQTKQWVDLVATPALTNRHRFFNAEFSAVKALLARNTRDAREQAAEWLVLLRKICEQSCNRRLMIDVFGMSALLKEACGSGEDALVYMKQAVLLAQPGKLIRPLADLGPGIIKLLNHLELDEQGLNYVGSVLSALHKSNETSNTDAPKLMPDALSTREVEILTLFASHLSNKEVAERLFISIGTVKRHAHNIYGKLTVGGRRDAVSKARGLGIL
jgi:LuxR family maltose regulon positive regulatory protein